MITRLRFEGVLFDLDGTLLDTLDDIADASNRSLERHGFPAHPTPAYRYFVGEGARVLVERTLPAPAREPDTIARLYEAFREEYSRNWNAKTKPYDGVREMLRALFERRMKIAVLSNKPDDFTRKCVREFFGEFEFDLVLGERDDVPPKPDPTGALKVASAIGARPEEMALVGDSSIDMRAAVAANMFPVGALWGFRTREELESSGAQEILAAPMEILSLLEKAGP